MINPAPRLPSGMTHRFDAVPPMNGQRSVLQRSHTHKTAFDADYLIPVFLDEVLPGDSMNLRATFFGRLATPIKPVLDNMYLDVHYFFIPNRLVWSNWEKFCGAQTNPGDSIAYTVPTIPIIAGGPEINTLADYFGIPTDQTNAFSVNTLPFRCYNLVWNTWYRAQELQNSLVVDVDDGPDTYGDYVLKKRGKRHDYFTACLLAPQRGSAVSLPLGTTAPVDYVLNVSGAKLRYWNTGTLAGAEGVATRASGNLVNDASTIDYIVDPAGSLVADLSTATAATINQLRTAFQTQALLERDARGGTRYCEIIRTHFGVSNPMDAVLQRPEYLGGSSTAINIHPVPQTAITSGSNALGQLAAYGTSLSDSGFNKSFSEHGHILGLASVRADITYSQGLDRMWSRSTRYDFFWPDLANIGEQSVLNKEIYNDLADGTGSTQRSGVFGYIPRYEEYRYKKSLITSVFRPAYATPLDSWHLSEEFSAQPTLGSTFIESSTPVDRVIAVVTEPHILLDAYFKYISVRPMPMYSIPGFGSKL